MNELLLQNEQIYHVFGWTGKEKVSKTLRIIQKYAAVHSKISSHLPSFLSFILLYPSYRDAKLKHIGVENL